MLDYFYILRMINLAIFIMCFLALMKKRGYTCKCKSKTKLVLTSILVIAPNIGGMPFGTVALFILILIILSPFLICKTIYKIDTKKSITQSNASRHLNKLMNANLVTYYKEAKYVYYKLNEDTLNEYSFIKSILEDGLEKEEKLKLDYDILVNYKDAGLTCETVSQIRDVINKIKSN
ncbi:ArsR/SmtB family transcription factor [Paraclostridium sordellii]|uniref:ArsR/SmtB family transcription factor n=1 Tax=Paraclostridium sordellii TaxID=1505 RepID=UPI0005E0854D|nr:ArsR family transcriptional regulator [Paeniclostridium sordellii]CEN24524.1 ArsR family transcriptional regulator [[Clostridium] sordellii] [Paeniclostridium sordellii]